jgi:hypothetical protein
VINLISKEEYNFYEVTGKLIYFEDGFKCRVTKDSYLGHLCGYVVVPKENPIYGLLYNQIPIAVHGGITYASHEDDEFYIGFDCAHLGDVVPGISRDIPLISFERGYEKYRDLSYVKNEISLMIRQLKLLEYNPITYKKAGKMILKGRRLFFKNSIDAGFITDIGDYKSLTDFIVNEYNRYAFEPQSPAEVMASEWYLVKED